MRNVALIVCFIVGPVSAVYAQKDPASVLCTRDIAVETARQQILLTRTFDNVGQRIQVLLRAADLLWPHEQDRAMAAFMEAFDLAAQNFKEHGDQVRRTSQSQFAAVIQLPDQRFKVIAALAKRDPAAARKLSEKMLQDDARDAEDKPAADNQSKRRTAENILGVASGLAATNSAAAVNLARQSLRFPATINLPRFLYELAKTNKPAADQFYAEALAVYRPAPMDQFLYLSSYPFGNTREAGEMPSYSIYQVPEGFVPNRALQRQFVQALLSRIEGAMNQAPATIPAGRYPEQAQMWLALNRLEKQLQSELPDLFAAATQAKERLFALLSPADQRGVNGVLSSENAPPRSWDERIEAAEKIANVDRRDMELAIAVIRSRSEQPIAEVVGAIDKISDSKLRGSLLNWVYYFRAQSLIAGKQLSEARTFASKVTELDQRAYLFSRIAEESLKQAEDQTEARDLLNELADAAGKAPKTIVSARALLALAYLYAKIDANRGVEELGNAIKTINVLESPDFSQQLVMLKIEGKLIGSYASISTPGFDPENAFREMGKIDFDGTLAQAAGFNDKSLRALTTLSVIEPCFAAKRPKTRK